MLIPCPRCRNPFNPPTQAEIDALAADDVIHICGRCSCLCRLHGDKLVPVTPAEELKLRLENPEVFAPVDSGVINVLYDMYPDVNSIFIPGTAK